MITYLARDALAVLDVAITWLRHRFIHIPTIPNTLPDIGPGESFALDETSGTLKRETRRKSKRHSRMNTLAPPQKYSKYPRVDPTNIPKDLTMRRQLLVEGKRRSKAKGRFGRGRDSDSDVSDNEDDYYPDDEPLESFLAEDGTVIHLHAPPPPGNIQESVQSAMDKPPSPTEVPETDCCGCPIGPTQPVERFLDRPFDPKAPVQVLPGREPRSQTRIIRTPTHRVGNPPKATSRPIATAEREQAKPAVHKESPRPNVGLVTGTPSTTTRRPRSSSRLRYNIPLKPSSNGASTKSTTGRPLSFSTAFRIPMIQPVAATVTTAPQVVPGIDSASTSVASQSVAPQPTKTTTMTNRSVPFFVPPQTLQVPISTSTFHVPSSMSTAQIPSSTSITLQVPLFVSHPTQPVDMSQYVLPDSPVVAGAEPMDTGVNVAQEAESQPVIQDRTDEVFLKRMLERVGTRCNTLFDRDTLVTMGHLMDPIQIERYLRAMRGYAEKFCDNTIEGYRLATGYGGDAPAIPTFQTFNADAIRASSTELLINEQPLDPFDPACPISLLSYDRYAGDAVDFTSTRLFVTSSTAIVEIAEDFLNGDFTILPIPAEYSNREYLRNRGQLVYVRSRSVNDLFGTLSALSLSIGQVADTMRMVSFFNNMYKLSGLH